MEQPQGYVDPEKPDFVCKLHKSLYGLKQAPRAWFDRLKSTLMRWKFVNSKADNSFLMLKTERFVIMVLIYVDDIIITSNDNKEMQMFIDRLHKVFSLKDLGNLHFFLGIEVYRDLTSMYLSQGKYVIELLNKLDMLNIKPAPTPMVAGKPLSANDGEALDNATLYRSIIGGLQYLTHTRPDIAYAVNKLSQFLKCPTTKHWCATKRVLRYLKGTLHHGLHIGQSANLSLIGYSDADWACCPDDRKSIGGYCVFFGDTLVSWSSKKQSVVARSSTESEYRSLAQVTAEIVWLESLLQEMQFTTAAIPVVWCDNISVGALASNPVYHARTKHIELDAHFV